MREMKATREDIPLLFLQLRYPYLPGTSSPYLLPPRFSPSTLKFFLPSRPSLPPSLCLEAVLIFGIKLCSLCSCNVDERKKAP